MSNYYKEAMMEELERCQEAYAFLKKNLRTLPHGKMKVKKESNKEYIYYSFKDKNGKIIEKYFDENTKENQKSFQKKNKLYEESLISLKKYEELEEKLKKVIEIFS